MSDSGKETSTVEQLTSTVEQLTGQSNPAIANTDNPGGLGQDLVLWTFFGVFLSVLIIVLVMVVIVVVVVIKRRRNTPLDHSGLEEGKKLIINMII